MRPIRVGITHGDINGIGPETITKVLAVSEMQELCTPVVFSSDKILHAAAEMCTLEQNINYNIIAHAADALDGRINLVNICAPEVQIECGHQTEASVQAEAASLQAALQAWQNHEIDVLVCCPGQLDNDQDHHALSDFIRQALQSDSDFDWINCGKVRTLMLHHIESTTTTGEEMARERFINDLKQINAQLRQDFGHIRPRLALLSDKQPLNEVASALREEGVLLFGPFAAEQFIAEERHGHYDGVLFLEKEAERHSLIDSFDSQHTYGYVGGLPIVLTTPMQTVSYAIAGQDKADEAPLRNAIFSAIDIYRTRINYKRVSSKPLEKQWNPKGRDDFKLDLSGDN